VSSAAEELHRALGLTDSEFGDIRAVLGRDPNHLELALCGVMWSEHCSYKSSRIHLRRLPTEAPHVLVGPGENAGVIDAGDGIAVAIRIESHNHPSAIEPYQGAATGVGGILRDVFTMGARPLAVMDPLFFGELTDARQRWLVEGVVSGISGYGNSVGVPTIGGELTFDDCYSSNPLVNVLCVGALPTERLVLGIASGVGNLAVLLGSSTGRDGIGGVSVLASAGFVGDDGAASLDDAKRPSVQVGDPYEEKRLIEACLELLDRGLVLGIQDLGGAGLVCATSETAARGGVGMDVDVTAVALREAGMAPYEIMTSESQERMLAIITPENWDDVAQLCAKWEVRANVVGHVVEPELDANNKPVGMLEFARASTARCSRRSRPRHSRTRHRSMTVRVCDPLVLTPCAPTIRPTTSRWDRPMTTFLVCSLTPRGCIASTIRNSFSTLLWDLAATRRYFDSRARDCHSPNAALRCRRTPTPGGARWTRKSARL
jgi:phosphoribosylformylglycinamidine synthase